MFGFILRWQLIFILMDRFQTTTIFHSSYPNEIFNLSSGFFCLYCGRSDHTQPDMSLIESKIIVDCLRPYYIFCSRTEAIGCAKYVKIIDYHIDIVRDCLRLTELHSFNIQCQSQEPTIDANITQKTFCCNDRHFCNRTSSSSSFVTWLLPLIDLLVFLIYYYT